MNRLLIVVILKGIINVGVFVYYIVWNCNGIIVL